MHHDIGGHSFFLSLKKKNLDYQDHDYQVKGYMIRVTSGIRERRGGQKTYENYNPRVVIL